MTAQALLTELHDAGVTIEAARGELRLDAPSGAMTPDLLSAVKSCKGELLNLLEEPADVASTPGATLLSAGPGLGSNNLSVAMTALARTTPSAPEYSTAHPPNKADIEWDRFLSVAAPMPDGSGWFDPAFGPDLRRGITGGQWDAFVADCGRLGRGSKA